MKNDYTSIAFILDRSGSMENCKEAAIQGFNRFLLEQQQAEGFSELTLILFDDEYLVPVHAIPAAEITPLSSETYVPRNSTALLDAIGRTIDELGARLAAMREKDRPAQVIVAILTDGLENASRQYTWQTVSDRIRHQTQAYNWTFLFLGANQDAIATAAQLSIAAANAAQYTADAAGTRSTGGALSRKVRAMKKMAMRTASAADEADAAAPMSEILEEEDRKGARRVN